MINEEKHYDLIKFADGDFSLDVKVSPDEDTVWLSANQIAILFDRDYKTVLKHIKNVFKEELEEESNSQKMRLSGSDKPTTFYNLNVIISIGYRVNSKRGVIFRQWANTILKQYLLNGYVINSDRILAYQDNILKLESNYMNIENRVKELEDTVYQANNVLFYEGQLLEPITFFRKLFFLAKESIIISDYYADNFLIKLLDNINLPITIITSTSSYSNKLDIPNNIKIIHNDNMHGRYICIDNTVYAVDNSFNAIGKKRFVIMKLESITKEMVFKGII